MTSCCVFITGATSGIGLGIAKTIASAGHHIAFNGLADADEIVSISAELEALGAASVHYFNADMRDGTATRAMIAAA
ncbi:MAG: SDR family NAD(P)-dependent oxidoreductase, partial [Alphaproteobacteria bacterium]|nr:SDR family NAD(P)-dependent oxidoreductase [Alphaproteobacteria bacterium]